MAIIPRVLFAAPASGSGKTMVTCGFLRALQRKGYSPVAFKCGPDYIDPMFHRSVLGVPGHNLDLFFTPEEELLRGLFLDGAAAGDVAVLEGVMGYYDGIGGQSADASSWHLAHVTGTPAILVLDAKGMSLSAAALVQGFARFRAPSHICGVLLNRCSKALHDLLAPAIEQECGLPVVGYLPSDPDYGVESRHLGLVTAGEIGDLRQRIDRLAEEMLQTVDVDGILKIAGEAPEITGNLPPVEGGPPVRIGVARDEAFCFYYAENFSLLEKLGAELHFFSPLKDEGIPADVGGLYIGGGYPELYAGALSQNKSMLKSVRGAAQRGLPVWAECGGFLYLQQQLEDEHGNIYPVVGALPGSAKNTGRLSRFGYITLTARADNLFGGPGESIRGHEFHYWDSDRNGGAFEARRASGKKGWPCVQANENLFAGFPHLYLWSNPAFARKFIERARCYGAG